MEGAGVVVGEAVVNALAVVVSRPVDLPVLFTAAETGPIQPERGGQGGKRERKRHLGASSRFPAHGWETADIGLKELFLRKLHKLRCLLTALLPY